MEIVSSPGRIWLIGGTAESKDLAQSLLRHAIPTVVTVTTEAARALYPQHPLLAVWVGRLGAADFESFLQQWHVVGILDASHPFAAEISNDAISASQCRSLPYLRYERAPLSQDDQDGVYTVPDLNTLLVSNWLDRQRVLLVLGYRHLAAFAAWHHRTELYARILPSVTALNAAYAAGFSSQRVVALRPPVSPAVEAALWQQWGITTVVAKASGIAGGETVKRSLAHSLNVRLILLARPVVTYPAVTGNLDEALQFCQQVATLAS